ncbi:hypothetical protein [Actinokineospora pegani]|uniref:hypothetical protein n=1 Tax=Actinokineospora pegani TaxID=2654637 RepID=UPI0012EA786A|nr:hypothetical protein [Actinokineospora pegani]
MIGGPTPGLGDARLKFGDAGGQLVADRDRRAALSVELKPVDRSAWSSHSPCTAQRTSRSGVNGVLAKGFDADIAIQTKPARSPCHDHPIVCRTVHDLPVRCT